jgi:hypothetical protein
VLDLTRGCLRAGEQEIDLPPKAFQVPTYLALNAGRLVPKEELLKAVWANVVVTDESLVQSKRSLGGGARSDLAFCLDQGPNGIERNRPDLAVPP